MKAPSASIYPSSRQPHMTPESAIKMTPSCGQGGEGNRERGQGSEGREIPPTAVAARRKGEENPWRGKDS